MQELMVCEDTSFFEKIQSRRPFIFVLTHFIAYPLNLAVTSKDISVMYDIATPGYGCKWGEFWIIELQAHQNEIPLTHPSSSWFFYSF